MSPKYPAVRFTLEPAPTRKAGTATWVATYGAAESRARFVIELVVPERGFFPNLEATGMLRRSLGTTDARPFLAELLRAHGEDDIAVETPHLDSLPFVAVVLGAALAPDSSSDSLAGHFTARKRGTWLLLLVSLGTIRPGASQVILALSPQSQEGALIPAVGDAAPAVMSVFGGLLTDDRE